MPSTVDRVADMSDQQFQQLAAAATFTVPPLRYWGGQWPEDGPQHLFLYLEDYLEVLYGGAAGGGKSSALLMAALQYVHVPHYSALLIRRTLPMLKKPGGLIARSHEWLDGTDASWNGNDLQWTFPSKATLSFGYLNHDDHLWQYQGSEFQTIGWDELTQFPERWYLYLFSRLRKPQTCIEHPDATAVLSDPASNDVVCEVCGRDAPPLAAVPLRMRGASNPGGIGNEWCKRRFLLKAPAHDDDSDDAAERLFVPARVYDNPHVNITDTVRALRQLTPEQQRQLLDGDWDAREPGDWVLQNPAYVDAAVEYAQELIELDRLTEPYHGHLYIAIDWGEITQSYILWPLEHGGVYVLPSEVVARHQDPANTTLDILDQARRFGFPVRHAAYDAAGVQSMRTFINTARALDGFETLKAKKVAFSKYKRETINYLRNLFWRTAEGYDTRLIAIHPDNRELVRQLKVWKRKSEEEEDVLKGDDHGPDALVAGVAPLAQRHRIMVADEYETATQQVEKPLADAALEAFERAM